ncbi:MAG: GNAT family N-acetyltransferase [Flavobacteriaceae bacterium]
MNIDTARLKMVPLSSEDVEDIFQLHSEEEVARYNTIGIPENTEVTRKVLEPLLATVKEEERTAFSWTIRLKEEGEFIGEIGFSLAPARYKLATIHYSILPKFWGKGYATEAVKALLKFCFEGLGLHRIEAGCAIENLASIRVLEKVGMRQEGRKRKVLPLKDGWSDNFEFAILKEDYLI